MNRSNPSNWDEDSSSREWSSDRGRGGGEGGRGYSSDQVYGQGIPSNQRGANRDDYRDRPRPSAQGYGQGSQGVQGSRPRGWDEERWNEFSDDEPRWNSSGYRESWQQNQGSRGRQGDFGSHFDARHPRFGESRLASRGRDDHGIPDYFGTSYEGQELARLRAGYRPDDESRRYADDRFGSASSHGSYGSASPTRAYGQGAYGGAHPGGSNYGTSARHSPHFGKGPKGYSRSDDRIRDDVCERLTYDPDVDASDVTVTVSQGEVTLAGEVEDRRAKRRAEDIIEDVPGVRDVHNQLRSRRGFFQSVVAEVTGKEHDENNVGKGPHQGTSTTTSPSSPPPVRNGGSAFRG